MKKRFCCILALILVLANVPFAVADLALVDGYLTKEGAKAEDFTQYAIVWTDDGAPMYEFPYADVLDPFCYPEPGDLVYIEEGSEDYEPGWCYIWYRGQGGYAKCRLLYRITSDDLPRWIDGLQFLYTESELTDLLARGGFTMADLGIQPAEPPTYGPFVLEDLITADMRTIQMDHPYRIHQETPHLLTVTDIQYVQYEEDSYFDIYDTIHAVVKLTMSDQDIEAVVQYDLWFNNQDGPWVLDSCGVVSKESSYRVKTGVDPAQVEAYLEKELNASLQLESNRLGRDLTYDMQIQTLIFRVSGRDDMREISATFAFAPQTYANRITVYLMMAHDYEIIN